MTQQLSYPTSQEADICLILEGTYPFVRGGVANWIHELVNQLSQYRFAIIFLGTAKSDYHGFLYELPQNLVHLEAHYLFEEEKVPKHTNTTIDTQTMEQIKQMHDKFTTYLSDPLQKIPELFELMSSNSKLNEEHFLRSKESWQLIIDKYSDNHADQSFFDYFWGVRSLHRPFWALRKITENIPNVKLLHSSSTGYAGFLGALLKKKHQIPYVITEHGIYSKERWIELMRNYFFAYITKKNNAVSHDKGLSEIWLHFFIILSKVAYSQADPIISLIEEYRQRQIAEGALPERTKIISYGIDFNTYKFLGKQKPNLEKPIIAFVGRVVPIKDVKTFIRACAIIIKNIPNAQAWIIGAVVEDPNYVEQCKDLTKVLGLEDVVKFLGVQNIMEFYPLFDVLLLTSISEASPFVVLESFAVGVPVVVTDVGGCRELIEGKNEEDKALGVAGKLVNIADPVGLATATIELLTNEQLWKSSQQIGLQRVRKYYSMSQFILNYNKIYEEAITHGWNRV